MSAPSAKPAPTLKDAIELLNRVQHARNFIDKHINVREAIEILKSLDAQQAAERTALQEAIEGMRTEFRNQITDNTPNAVKWNVKGQRFFEEHYRKAIAEIEARERAGAKT